jgi:hypothetical protein
VSLGRGLELARGAKEQLRAELAFEQCDPLAHGRLPDAEFVGGHRETATLQGADKGAQAIDPVHPIIPIRNRSYPTYSIFLRQVRR